jgi:hypothetical protein
VRKALWVHPVQRHCWTRCWCIWLTDNGIFRIYPTGCSRSVCVIPWLQPLDPNFQWITDPVEGYMCVFSIARYVHHCVTYVYANACHQGMDLSCPTNPHNSWQQRLSIFVFNHEGMSTKWAGEILKITVISMGFFHPWNLRFYVFSWQDIFLVTLQKCQYWGFQVAGRAGTTE